MAGTLVSGGNPPLNEMTQTTWGTLFSSLSPQRWAQEALFLNAIAPDMDNLAMPGVAPGGPSDHGYACQFQDGFSNYCANLNDSDYWTDLYGYSVSDGAIGNDVLMLFVLGIALRVIATLLTIFK